MAGQPPAPPPPPPMVPPPPAPPPPPPGWQPARPASGKAIASLVLGLLSIIGVFCYLPVVAAFIGIALGVAGVYETGREGKRTGRGLAIAGIIVCVLGIGVTASSVAIGIALSNRSKTQVQQNIRKRLDKDQDLLIKRLQQYYLANDNSLGPGGPVLARSGKRYPPGTAPANNAPATKLKVTDALLVEHLADPGELGLAGSGRRGGAHWELTVTGQSTATLRAYDWSGALLREVDVRDAGRAIAVRTAQ